MIYEPDRTPSRTESKVGGVPYWDASLPFPLNEDGKPMSLLAQIVLDDLPENDMFPREGMLQFFIGDSCPGDSDEERRIIWHRTIDPNQPEPPFTPEEDVLPFEGECAIRFESEDVSISPEDYKTEEFMHQAAEELGVSLEPTVLLDEMIEHIAENELWEALRGKSAGSHLLGYPVFAQQDPREPDDDRNVLLLQIDSQSEPFYICWGDFGTANFFISAEKLKQMDFSDVMFTWDCY